MSYCRWSSDNFMCDVYTYAHCDGSWTTHVAGARHKERAPDDIMNLILKKPKPTQDEIIAHAKMCDEWHENNKPVEIGLAHDGKTFKDASPEACAQTLLMLRGSGYNVPQYAIDELLAEAKENSVAESEKR